MSVFSIETKRLELKVIDEAYTEHLLDYLLRNRSFHRKYVPERSPNFFTSQFQRNRLSSFPIVFTNELSIRFHIFPKDEKDKIIGEFSFENIIKGGFLSCFLGYMLDQDYQGKGIMKEALQAGIAYIFNEVKLHRVEANVMPENTRSANVLRSLGFEKEGTAKKYLKINGVWQDHDHWVLLNEAVE